MVSTRYFSDRRETFLLLFVLAGALILRLWGNRFGLPYLYANDEYHEVMRAMELGSGSFNFDRITKGGLYFLLFFEYGVYFVLLTLSGAVDSALDFARQFTRDPSAFYHMGRVTVALFGVLNVFLVYLLARRAFAAGAGILVALFLAANALHSNLSHKINIDVVMTCFASAALLVSIKLAENGSTRDYVFAAVLAALATTTKIPAVMLVVPLLIAHTYRVRSAGGGATEWLVSRQLWTAVGVFAAVLLVTNPGIVFVHTYIVDIFFQEVDASELALQADDAIDEYGAPDRSLLLFYLTELKESMGWPLFVTSLAGLAYALAKRTRADVILISFAAAMLIAILAVPVGLAYDRYVLPVAVVLLILGARALHAAWRSTAPSSGVAITAVAVALIAMPAYDSVVYSRLLTQTDLRTLAKEWIDTNVPAGAKVFIEGAKIMPVRTTVPLQDTAEVIERRIAYWSVEEPKQAEFLKFKLDVVEGTGFDLELVPVYDIESLQAYRDRRIEYFVVDPDRFFTHRYSSSASARFIEDLRSAPDVTLIKRFEAEPNKRPGPTHEVYRLDLDYAAGHEAG